MSNAFSTRNTQNQASACTQRISALKADVPATTSISINGSATTVANVIAIYQQYLDHQAALTAKRAEEKSLLAARDEALAKCQTTDPALSAWVSNQFGANSQQAHDFGFAPRKTPVVSAATRALAAQKAAATRKARGTIGKKKKLAIKGAIPAQPGGSAPPMGPLPPIVAPTVTPNGATH